MTTSNDFYEVNEPSFSFKANNSHITSVARIAIPVLLSFYTPIKQGVVKLIDNNKIGDSSTAINLGIYINNQTETSDFNMTQNISDTTFKEYKDNVSNQLSSIQNTLNELKNTQVTSIYVDKQISDLRNWILGGLLVGFIAIFGYLFGVVVPMLKDIILALN